MRSGGSSAPWSPGTLRCLIVDDTQFVAAARSLLERQGVTVVGGASTSGEALRLAAELRSDVLLVDIDLGGESGFELARGLDHAPGHPPVVLISTHVEEDYAELLADSPAVGFLPKTILSATAVHNLLDGRAHGRGRPVSGPPET